MRATFLAISELNLTDLISEKLILWPKMNSSSRPGVLKCGVMRLLYSEHSPPGKTARSRGPRVLSASMVKMTVSVIILYWCRGPTLRSPNSRNKTSPGSRPATAQMKISYKDFLHFSTCRPHPGRQAHIEDNVGEAAANLANL